MFEKIFGRKNRKLSSEKDGVDLLMRYCPSCNEEYRLEVTSCASCRVPLISGKEWQRRHEERVAVSRQRSLVIDPGDTLVPLQQGSLQDMKMVQELLKKERIPSLLSGDEMSCRGCRPQLTLEIRKIDLAAARKILSADFLASTGVNLDDLAGTEAVFDIQAEEVTCPACGSRFSPTVGACPECGLNFT